jgi:23S rRNA (guanosine2251-2'-O)-methyltransferase
MTPPRRRPPDRAGGQEGGPPGPRPGRQPGSSRGGRGGDRSERGPGRSGRRPPASRETDRDGELGGGQVEGRQAVRELLRAGARPVHHVLIAEGLEVTGEGDHPLDEILVLAEERGIPVRRVPRDRLERESGTEAPQGVIARADPISPARLDRLAHREAGRPAPFLVVLDGVTDPHNLGAIMRSAVGSGATGLVVGRHRSAHLSPTAVKAAAGAVEHLPVALVSGVPAALAELAAAGVWTVGLDVDGSGVVWDLEVATEALAVVLGAEGRGLSRLARQRCELTRRIPLLGPLASLNVSAAAAVACFEVARRRGEAAPARPAPRPPGSSPLE